MLLIDDFFIMLSTLTKVLIIVVQMQIKTQKLSNTKIASNDFNESIHISHDLNISSKFLSS